MSKNKTAPAKLRGMALEQEVLKLRLAGASFRAIARNLECSVGAAYKACMRAIERQMKEIGEDADTVLHLELQRLDAMLLGVWPAAAAGDLAAIDRVLRLMERRARYLSLDAPQRTEHTGKDGGPMKHEFSHLSDEELDAALAAAEAAERGEVAAEAAHSEEAGTD